MDFRYYVAVVRKRWRLILLATVLSVSAGAGATFRQENVYLSTSRFFISGPATADIGEAISGQSLAQQRVASYSALVTSTPVVNRVLERANATLGDRPTIAAAPVGTTVVIEISVTGSDPQRVHDVAQAYSTVFPDLVNSLERPPQGGAAPVKATLVEPPFVATEPISPNPPRNIAIAALVGLLVGGSAALVREVMDTSLKSAGDLAEASGAAVLGVLAEDPSVAKQPLTLMSSPLSPQAESIRQLRTNLQFADADHRWRSLLVTSPTSSEGKSFVSCNLAIAIADAGERVVLVEADLRRPSVRSYMGIEGTRGLSDVLVGQANLADVIQDWHDGLLKILPGGRLPPNPSELLGSQAMLRVLQALEQFADVVIFDTPPMLAVTDAAVLAPHVSGVLLVAQQGSTSRSEVAHAAEGIRRVGGTLVGAALNRAPATGPDSYLYTYQRYDASGASDTPLVRPSASSRVQRSATPQRPVANGQGAADVTPAAPAVVPPVVPPAESATTAAAPSRWPSRRGGENPAVKAFTDAAGRRRGGREA
ncbi:MAG TPA: polysaccharide biosynthesis tyrosine autokinase [Mycobacteriales bacterium]|nr:polysaccharide biosynthesis tyrosine autokinase [Mycobacteriales bacterium]